MINHKGTRMVKDGYSKDGLHSDELGKFRLNFSRHTNRGVARLTARKSKKHS